jgi:2'-hydroxyisoflavone reductase
MRILVLGGTSFVGRHIVEAALAKGHEVTLFNRGKTNPGLFDGVEQRHGDRKEGDYASLASGEWDALVDVNAYYPRAVQEAAAAVDGRVSRYLFISTCSVYNNPGDGPVGEDHELATVEDPATEEVTNESYGGLKVLCEQAVVDAFGPSNTTVVRPGMVGGPHDPTDRFTYWVRRAARGGTILAPRPTQPIQVVHARDQGDFVVRLLEDGTSGAFNSVGPSTPVDFEGMVQACIAAAGTDAEVVWVDEDFLAERKIQLDFSIPASADFDGLFRCTNDKAQADGLVNRPIEDTAADTLAWDRTRDGFPGDFPGRLSSTDEAAVLEEWRSR